MVLLSRRFSLWSVFRRFCLEAASSVFWPWGFTLTHEVFLSFLGKSECQVLPVFSGEMSPVNVFCYLRLFYKTIMNVDHTTWCHKWSFVKPSTSSWQEGHVLRENFPGGWSSYPETWQTCFSQRNNTPPVSICLVAHEKNMFKRKIIKTHYWALHAQTTRV